MKTERPFLTFLAVIPFFFYVQAALSQDCNSMVRDDAGMLGGEMAQVTAAAEALQNAGAQVYVRTFPTTGDQATATQLEHSIESHCPDWQSANGGRKENLIAIVYADRDRAGKHSITISTGGRIDSVIPPTQIDRIRAQVIIPELKRNRAGKGFTEGLNAIKAAYEGQQGTGTVVPEATPAQPQSKPVQPMSLAWLWVLLLGIGLGIFWRRFSSFSREREARRAARLRAQQVYNSVTAQINTMEENQARLRGHYDLLALSVPADERQKVEAALARSRKTYDEACADFGTKRTSDLEKEGLSVPEYDTLRETYQSILDKLNQAGGLISETESHLDNLQAQIEGAPKKVQEARAELEQLLEGLRQVKQAGFQTETYEALAAKAQLVLGQANEAINNRLFFEALAGVSQGKEILEQASQGKGLADKKADLDSRIASLKMRVENARNSVGLCKPVIDRMDAVFARQSFESVSGNGSQAAEHIHWCERGLPLAADFAGMQKQDWQKAADIVAEAGGHLDRVDSLVSSIQAMELSLNTAKEESPKDIEEAERDLHSAEDYIVANKNDLRTETETKLSLAREAIAAAKAELQQPKPDYFEIVKSARKAHAAVDELLATARSEQQAAERLRQKAATALRDATSRVTKAQEYIEDHSRYVNETATRKAEDAGQYLKSAQKCNESGDLEGVVKWAELADDAGKVAYNDAKDDVQAQVGYNPYDRANRYYAPSLTTIFVNESSDNFLSVGAASDSSSSSSSGGLSSWFGGGSDSSSSFSSDSSSSFSGSDSSSSFDSGGGSDSSSSW
jgi:uncharacterized membrane protein YgcG